VALLDEDSGEEIGTVRVGQPIVFKLRATAHRAISNLVLGCMIRDRTGHVVWGTNTWHTHQSLTSLEPGDDVEFLLRTRCNLGPGSYSLTHALTVGHHHAFGNYEWIDNNLVFDVVNVDRTYFIGTTHLDAAFEIKRSTEWTRQTASP
jgi:lipopolysaccharide transport system ATP-binding protein